MEKGKSFYYMCVVFSLIVLALPAWGAMSDTDFINLCTSGSMEAIHSAIQTGANVNAKSEYSGMTALMTAARLNTNIEVIITLIKAGADVNAKDKNGQTAANYAKLYGNNKAYKLLTDYAANHSLKHSSQSENSAEQDYQQSDRQSLSQTVSQGNSVKQNSQKSNKHFPSLWFFAVPCILISGFAYLRNRESNEVKALRAKAEGGDVDAQRELADMYCFGKRVRQNHAKAMEFYKMAAEKGDAIAKCRIGDMYFSGWGFSRKNLEEAVKWWHESAEGGNRAGQYNMALYLLGNFSDRQPTEQENQEAIDLLLKAAKNGNNLAKIKLGDICKENNDESGACKWYIEAAEAGNTKAMIKCAPLLPIKEGEKWLRKAAELGEAQAQIDLACRLLNIDTDEDDEEAGRYSNYPFLEHGSPSEVHEAFQWLEKAADNGYIQALLLLGDLCNSEQEEIATYKDDMNEAAKFYRQAATGGNKWANTAKERLSEIFVEPKANAVDNINSLERPTSALEKGLGYLYGENGRVQNTELGIQWLKASFEMSPIFPLSDNNKFEGAYELGRYYLKRNSKSEALKWFKAGASYGHSASEFILGIMYVNGEGTTKNVDEGVRWVKKAALHGNMQAKEQLIDWGLF